MAEDLAKDLLTQIEKTEVRGEVRWEEGVWFAGRRAVGGESDPLVVRQDFDSGHRCLTIDRGFVVVFKCRSKRGRLVVTYATSNASVSVQCLVRAKSWQLLFVQPPSRQRITDVNGAWYYRNLLLFCLNVWVRRYYAPSRFNR